MSGQEIRRIYRTAQKEDYPESLKLVLGGETIEYAKVRWKVEGRDRGLRYGTNPHQKAALYKPAKSRVGIGNVDWVKWGKDGPSATNIEDGSHGLRIVRYFESPTVAVMKHLNPSGVATQTSHESLREIYTRARDADPRAAFGSVVVFNRQIDRPTAEELSSTFVEVIYAPGYDDSALGILNSKKDIRLGRVRISHESSTHPDIVVLDDGSLVLEDSYATRIQSIGDIKTLPVATKRTPSDAEYMSILYSWWTACEVRSNAVVFWNEGTTLAVGTGQQDRIGAIEGCIDKAHRNGHSLRGSIMASDGFLPKMDNVEAVANQGVSAIIQPGGSIEDAELIRACDDAKISMVLTGERSFRHF